VKDFGRLIGILSERDMLKAMAGRVHTSESRVREWMTPDPICVTPETPLEEAAQIMLDNEFRHLPVLEEGRVTGVASLRRVVAAMQPAASS
jgi:CBS domain-containing protein